MNFTYSYYNNYYVNIYKENTLYKSIVQGINNKYATMFHLEYNHTFSTQTNLQMGYGNRWKKINTDYYTTETFKSSFEQNELRNSLYLYYSWKQNDKFGIKAGSAGEVSIPKVNGQKNNYLILQPHIVIKYTPLKMLDLKAIYHAESNYPNISQTNPFANITDQHTIRTGNPYLKPEVVHKTSLQINILGGLITLHPYYHFANNYISETGILQDDSIFKFSYDNAGRYVHYGTKINFIAPIGKILVLQSGLDFYKSSIYYANKNNNINDWTANNQLIYSHQNTKTVAGIFYQKSLNKDITAQGYNYSGNDFWGLLLQQEFFRKNLNMMILYIMPIDWGVDFKQEYYVRTYKYSENKIIDLSSIKNMIVLRAEVRFTTGEKIKKTEKEVEIEKEKEIKGIF